MKKILLFLYLFITIQQTLAINFQHIKNLAKSNWSKLGVISGASLAGGIGFYAAKKNNDKSSAELQYTINLMWINKKLQEEQHYIFPAKDCTELEQKFLNNVFTWGILNPKSIVHVWFDSALTPAQAVEKTKTIIEENLCKNPKTAPIGLKDIRELPHVKDDPEIFSDKTPVYFRADLLRTVAAVHMLSTTKSRYFVYADLDVQPMSQDEIFDTSTCENLEKYGFVMAAGHNTLDHFENSFQILSKHKPNLFKAINSGLIDLSMQQAYAVINNQQYYRYKNNDYHTGGWKGLPQIVWSNYLIMFSEFCELEGVEVDKPIRFEIPTKKVIVPPLSFNYLVY